MNRFLILVLSVVSLSACSSSAVEGGEPEVPCVDASACTSGQSCSDGVCVDSPSGGDASAGETNDVGENNEALSDTSWAPADTSEDNPGPNDTAVERVADDTAVERAADVPEDSAEVVEPPPSGGDFGEPCEEDLDCYSGLCVQHMGDEVCTKTCDSECPAGWSCEQVIISGSDPIYICVSSFEHLCQPCQEASDCASNLSAVACVSYGDEGGVEGPAARARRAGSGRCCPGGATRVWSGCGAFVFNAYRLLAIGATIGVIIWSSGDVGAFAGLDASGNSTLHPVVTTQSIVPGASEIKLWADAYADFFGSAERCVGVYSIQVTAVQVLTARGRRRRSDTFLF